MADRERVIEHITDCVRIADCQINHNWVFVRADILKDALALLEAQEVVKPYVECSEHTGTKWFICGSCEQPMIKITPNAVYPNYCPSNTVYPNYCPECGRKVKWDG